jgi:hypothetical protein
VAKFMVIHLEKYQFPAVALLGVCGNAPMKILILGAVWWHVMPFFGYGC